MGWRRSQRTRQDDWLVPFAVFVFLFGTTTYVLTPDAPGKEAVRAEWNKRTTDQQYRSCDDARANGHENIAVWEPSYRQRLDRDGDGSACESYQ